MSRIKKIVDNIYKIPGSASLEELYQVTDSLHLPVEPFSKKQAIADFILEGGTGYNSVLNGSLGEHVFEMKASYNGKPFTYGLPFSTLYATGYPLHRIIEGSKSNKLIKDFDNIDYITIPLSDSRGFKVFGKQSSYISFDPPPFAINALFLNKSGAKLLGAKNEGFFVILPDGKEPEGEGWENLDETIWENRFFIDTLNDVSTMTVFTQKSSSLLVHNAFKEKKLSGLFMAVFTKKGILVKVTGTAAEMDEVWDSIKDQVYTYKLG
jgi:hypothetical protein